MEEFEKNGDERIEDDDFYEKIEAPKFVDLTAPDRHRPQSDDRYWFCLRVGCDQKHEEEMDSEAIYKNFLLRVMAARSPNVKPLRRNDSLKCPRTVPAKASKSRISKLAIISSVYQKMADANKKKPMPLPHHTPTPNRKLKQPSAVAKAMTTPRNRKGISNPGPFRSARNPKPPAIQVPNNRVIAKALVFHSPKKVVRLKKSIELSSSRRKMCAGMKRLEIANGKKDASQFNKDVSRKQLRGREVKSRVYDSLRSQKEEGQETKPPQLLKTKNHDQEFQLTKAFASPDRNKRKPNIVDVEEEKPNGNSLKSCSVSATAVSLPGKGNKDCLDNVETCQQQRDEHRSSTLLETSELEATSPLKSGKSEPQRQEDNKTPGDMLKPSSEDKRTDKAVEIAPASNGELKDNKVMGLDDKENASTYDENRKSDSHASKSMKKNVLIKHENSRSTQKEETKIMSRALKERAAVNSTQGQPTKYRKPKPTNPKPFRLRTDERRILKEANLEKKQLAMPVKEVGTRIPESQRGCSQLQQKNMIKVSNAQQKPPCSLQTNVESPGQTGNAQFAHKAAEESVDAPLRGPKSAFIKKAVRPQGVASRKKALNPWKPGQLEVSPASLKPKKASKPIQTGGAASVTSASPQIRRPAPTTPKEPNFHSIHLPKSCTRRVARPLC